MAISITFHGERPRDSTGDEIDALGPQVGDAQAVSGSYTFPSNGLYRVKSTASHVVRFGDSSLSSSTGGEAWTNGEKEIRYMWAGFKVYVS